MADPDEAESGEGIKSNLPIDRGWAWMILLGTSLIYFILVGTYKAFGIFFVAIIEKYNCTVTVATLIGAFYNVMYIAVSIPLTVGIKYISTRKICMTGAVMFTVGYILSSVAPSIEWLVVIQSGLCGAADALLMAPAVIILGKYFKKRRGVANGIAFGHISLGSLVLPNFFHYIVEEYGLQGAFILTAGLTMNMMVAASLFRPISFYSKKSKRTVDKCSNDRVKIDENFCEDGDKILERESHIGCSDLDSENQNISQDLQLLPVDIKSELKSDEFPVEMTSELKSEESEYSEVNKLSNSMHSLCALEVHFSGSVSSLASEPEELQGLQESSLASNYSKANNEKYKSFFKKECKNISFIQSFRVLQNKTFLIFTSVIFFGGITTGNIFTFIPHHAEQRGVDKTRAALLVSIMSLTDFIGRLLSGYLADRRCIKRITIILISQSILSMVLFSTQLYSQFWELVIFCACSGFSLGMITALMGPITVDIVGIDDFGAGMTVILVMMSISHAVSMVIIGLLRDYTGDYVASFYYLASTALASAILSFVILKIKK